MEITFDVDVMSTYNNNYRFNECLIERESYTPDSFKDNILPEPVTCDDYVNETTAEFDLLSGGCSVLLFCAPPEGIQLENTDTNAMVRELNGIITGCRLVVTDYTVSSVRAALHDILYTRKWKIMCAYIVPDMIVNAGSVLIDSFRLNFNVSGILNNHTVRNRKLFTYPYSYIELSSTIGGCSILRPENFYNSGIAQFQVYGSCLPTPTMSCVPINYGNVHLPWTEGISANNFPQVAVQSDSVALYTAQHNTSNALELISNVISGAMGGAIAGASAGGAEGAVIMGVLGAATATTTTSLKQEAAFAQEYKKPQNYTNQGGNGAIQLGCDDYKIYARFKTLKTENIARIDDYFTRFGYARGTLATPSISYEYNRKYIKTRGCSIKSQQMPVWASNTICQIHDRGVTYWNSLNNVGNYLLN